MQYIISRLEFLFILKQEMFKSDYIHLLESVTDKIII